MPNKLQLHPRALLLGVALVLSTNPAAAQGGAFSLHAWGQISPFISGRAGSGSGAPGYGDAFSTGRGGGLELARQFSNRFCLLGGLGYEAYGGRTHQGITFDDLEVIPVYLGAEYQLAPEASPWRPFLKVALGTAHLSSVSISYAFLQGTYWDSSWVFLVGGGAGLEFRSGRWGVDLEVLARYVGKPDSAMDVASNAQGSWVIPIHVGLRWHF